jgi:Pup amidohydrolase
VGDANMSEVATYLKVGTTAILLAMIEDNELGDDWLLGNPVPAIRQVSHDPTMRRTIILRDGRRATALELQWGLLERARKYEHTHGLDPVGEEIGADVLAKWERVLAALEGNPLEVAEWVDWIAKQRLVDGFADRHGLSPASAKLKAIDLQYHDLRRERCLALKVGLDTIVAEEDVLSAMVDPPTTTRAYFRGRCLQKYPNEVVAANWDSLVFDVGRDPLRRVPMMEPLRGTADHVGKLIDESATASELLQRLGA